MLEIFSKQDKPTSRNLGIHLVEDNYNIIIPQQFLYVWFNIAASFM